MALEWPVAAVVLAAGVMTILAAVSADARRGIATACGAGVFLAFSFILLGSLRLGLVQAAVAVGAYLLLRRTASAKTGAAGIADADALTVAAVFLGLGLLTAVLVRAFGMAAWTPHPHGTPAATLPLPKPAAVVGAILILFAAAVGAVAVAKGERR